LWEKEGGKRTTGREVQLIYEQNEGPVLSKTGTGFSRSRKGVGPDTTKEGKVKEGVGRMLNKGNGGQGGRGKNGFAFKRGEGVF